jgi:hypothetical protein
MRIVALPAFAIPLVLSGFAAAQDTAPPTAPTPAPAPAPAAAPAPAEKAAPEVADHEAMIHHVGVGYLGTSQIPIAQVNGGVGGGITADSITAPYIGVRYWFSSLVGLDLGVGFAYSGGSNSVTTNGVTVSTDIPSRTGFGLHGGVPLALAYSKHFAFEVIPEVTFGYATSTLKGTAPAPDIALSGFRFDIGARVGGEVQFGFIGVPQLALQASIGLGFRYQSISANAKDNSTGFSQSGPSFATTVQDAPWAIFTNNISALYYF